MKHLQITKPCSENWDNMTPTEKGAFCQKCTKQVIDFTKQSLPEIRSTLYNCNGDEVCGRIDVRQLDALNRDFERWMQANQFSPQRVSFYTLLFVFGLAMVSCSNQEQKQLIEKIQLTAAGIIQKTRPDLAQDSAVQDEGPVLLLKKDPIEKVDVEVINDQIISIDPVYVTEEKVLDVCQIEYRTMGAMSSRVEYRDYLEAVVPQETAQYDANGVLIPTEFNAVAFPNPTEGRTALKFEVPTKISVNFSLYSSDGSFIRSLGAADYEPGTYEIPFDLSGRPPGTYLITILSKEFKKTVRVSKI